MENLKITPLSSETEKPLTFPSKKQETLMSHRPTLADRIGGRGSAFKFSGVIVVISGYSCGYLYWIDYLSRFNLNIGLFSKTTPEYFVLGAFAIYELANSFLDTKDVGTIHVLGNIFLTALGIGIYVSTVVFFVEFCSKLTSRSKRVGNFSKTMSRWIGEKVRGRAAVKAGAKGAGAVILVFYLMVASSFCIVFLYSIPNAIAEAAANREYVSQLAKFGNGCEDEDAVAYCFEVSDSQNKPIGRGFIVASSDDYVALSDNGRSRVISLQGRQLVQLDMPVSQTKPAH